MTTTPSRRAVLIGAAGVVLGGGAAGVAWALRDEPDRTAGVVARPSARATTDWRVAVRTEPVCPPLRLGDALYVYDLDGVASRVDARSGRLRWKRPTPARIGSAHFGAVPAGDAVVVGGSLDDTRGAVLALDAGSGEQRWRYDTAILPLAALVPGSDVLATGDHTGRLVGIAVGNGSERWRHDPVPGAPNFNGIKRITPVGDLVLAVHEYDGDVYSGHVLIALDRTGAVRWSVDASEADWTPRPDPTANAAVPPGQLGLVPWVGDEVGGLVHVIRSPGYVDNVGGADPATSEELIACRADTGERVWSLRAHRVDAPLRRGNTLYVRVLTAAGRKGEVRAVDAATGAVRWSARMRVGSTFAHQTRIDAAGDVVTVGDGYGLVVLDAADGAERWSAADSDGTWFGPVLAGDRVVVPDSSGTRTTLRSWRIADGSPFPPRGGLPLTRGAIVAGDAFYLSTDRAIHAFALPMT